MKHGSLFSGGCDGFSLAAKWAGWQTVFQVEQNEFRKNTLAKNFPEAKRYGDIKRFDAKPYRGTIDIISGGFPCQPFSIAGKQRGKADDRYLWPEMLRIVKEVRPSWVVGENVAAITKMALNEVLSNLEAIGYATGAYIIPACALNAPHRRERVCIVAYSDRFRLQNKQEESEQPYGFTDGNIHAPDTNEQGLQRRLKQTESREKQSRQFRPGNSQFITNSGTRQPQPWNDPTQRSSECFTAGRNPKSAGFNSGCDYGRGIKETRHKEDNNHAWDTNCLEVATKLCTMDDGLPEGLAKAERSAIYRAVKYFGRRETEKILGISLKKVNPWRNEELAATGDAIVPQVAYEIFKAINEYTNET